MDREFLQARIDATKAQIIEYENAVLQISSGAFQSYNLNTGQSTQTVTRFDLNRLQSTIDSLYNRLTTLEARLKGCGVVTAGPAW